MNRILGPTFVAALLVIASGTLRAAEPEIQVEVDSRRIFEGESLVYSVTLNHIENPSPPELNGFDEFQVTSLGHVSLNSRSITIINGRKTEKDQLGRRYDYRLIPKRSGTLTIPAPTAKVGNQVLTGRTVQIQVEPPSDQDTAIVEIRCDTEAVYPMQPFTISLSVAIRELPKKYADRSPIEVQQSAPELTIPWVVDDADLPDGLRASQDWKEWLGPMEARRGGFRINNIGSGSLFARSIAFQPKPRRVTRKTKGGDEAGYWEYVFSREFIAQRPGHYNFGPVSLKGVFVTGMRGSDELDGRSLFAIARPITVIVKDVPDVDRPKSYIGAIGEFTVSASVAPESARVGDPMTLTLTLKGRGTLEETSAPDLSQIPEFAERFKAYEATSETQGNSRRFTYGLRPLRPGNEPFPAVPVSYFDVKREEYVTIETQPVPIQIGEADHLSDREIVASGGNGSPGAPALQARSEGIFANITDVANVRNDSVRPGLWLGVWGGLLGLYLATTLIANQLERRNSDPAVIRRRGAAARARGALRAALAEAQSATGKETADRVRAVLTGLVADLTAAPEAGMTIRDVQERLRESGVDAALIERVSGLLSRCDAARYGSGTENAGNLAQEAEPLVNELTKALQTRSRLA